MVTEKDLRFAFHMDTGSQGFWNPDRWKEKTLWEGHPTSEYGAWLEERAGNQRWLRRAFQFENKIAPTYNGGPKKRRRGYTRYTYSWFRTPEVFEPVYVYWLEERILNKNPQIVKDILHLP